MLKLQKREVVEQFILKYAQGKFAFVVSLLFTVLPLEIKEIADILTSTNATITACGLDPNNQSYELCLTEDYFSNCNNFQSTIYISFTYQTAILLALLVFIVFLLGMFQILLYSKRNVVFHLLKFGVYTSIQTKRDLIVLGGVVASAIVYSFIKYYIYSTVSLEAYKQECAYNNLTYYLQFDSRYGSNGLTLVVNAVVTLTLFLPVAQKIFEQVNDLYNIPIKKLLSGDKWVEVRQVMANLTKIRYVDLVRAMNLYNQKKNKRFVDPSQMDEDKLDELISEWLPMVLDGMNNDEEFKDPEPNGKLELIDETSSSSDQ